MSDFGWGPPPDVLATLRASTSPQGGGRRIRVCRVCGFVFQVVKRIGYFVPQMGRPPRSSPGSILVRVFWAVDFRPASRSCAVRRQPSFALASFGGQPPLLRSEGWW